MKLDFREKIRFNKKQAINKNLHQRHIEVASEVLKKQIFSHKSTP